MFPLLAKAGAATAITGITCAGFVLTSKEYEPEWLPLVKDEFFDKDLYYNRKFGGWYKNYMVGVQSSREWWEKSYGKLVKDMEVSEPFQANDRFRNVNVRMAYSPREVDVHALNQLCGRIYKTEHSKIKKDPANASEYSQRDVWKYCSALGERPRTLMDNYDRKEERYAKESVGYKIRGRLVDVRGNDLFWRIRNDEFYGDEDFRLKYPVDLNQDKYFYGKWKAKREKMREICGETYYMSGDGKDGGAKEKEIYMFCGLR